MKSLLFSWGGAINSRQIFETHFNSKWSKQRVAYVSNAKDFLPTNERANQIKSSIEKLRHSVKEVVNFDLYKNKDLFSPDYIKQNFDVIYVGGGSLASLISAVDETNFKELLINLSNSEVKYIGSSAGAMLASKSMKVAGWYPGEEELGVVDKEGLGFIPFEIFPHYEEAHKELIASNSDNNLILLPDNSAVGLEGGELYFYNQARLLL